MLRKITLPSALLLLLAANNTHAGLIGLDINGVLSADGIGSLSDTSATVADPGLEFTRALGGGASFDANFDDDGLDIIFNIGTAGSSPATVRWAFTLLDPDLIFTNIVEIADNVPTGGVTFDGLTNNGQTINFSTPAKTFPTNSSFTARFDVDFLDNSAPAGGSVPAPAPMALMGLGLLGLAARRRK